MAADELLGQVQALHLAPGDTLVLTVDRRLSHEEAERLRASLEARFPGNKALVLEGGMALATISEQGGQLDRIEAMLATLVDALADDEEEDPEHPSRTLDGDPAGQAREPGTPL